MTWRKRTIMEMAREAWAETGEGWVADAWFDDRAKAFEAFAALVRADERVACLDCGSPNIGIAATYDSLINSVKTQPEQEPVAWRKQLTGAQRNELKQIDRSEK